MKSRPLKPPHSHTPLVTPTLTRPWSRPLSLIAPHLTPPRSHIPSPADLSRANGVVRSFAGRVKVRVKVVQVVHLTHFKVQDELVVWFARQAGVVRGNGVHPKNLISGISQRFCPLNRDRVEQLSGDRLQECVWLFLPRILTHKHAQTHRQIYTYTPTPYTHRDMHAHTKGYIREHKYT